MLSIFTKQKNWLFLLLLIGISFYYDYHHIVFKPSQGIHQWRQTDGASFARNYYMEGMKFFQPKTHNLTSDGGKTSFAATADTPFLYYSVAILYKIFGYHEFIYRLLNTLIFLTGLFYLFRAFYLLFEDVVWASAIALLAFSSPVLVYYASNFIPDSTALSMVFIAFYHFINYWKNSGSGSLIWMMFFFFLAGSLKITALITYIAISCLFLLEWTGWISFSSKKIFQHKKLFIFGTIISTGLVFAWVFYASWFNRIHECSYFSTTIFPVWRMDSDGIRFILTSVKNNWIRDYYHYSVYIIAALSIVYFCLNFKKVPPVFRILFPVLFLLGISFLLLQFTLLKDHDYYVINLYIIPIILLGTVVYSLKQYYPTSFSSVYMKSAMIIFVVFNIWYSGKNLDNRYNGEDNLRKLKANDFYDITPYLRELGLTRENRVISIPGRSHINLYLMDQKGWTQFTDHKLHRGEEFYYYNRDREGILKSIENGAEYLIISDINQLFDYPFLQEFASHLSGKFKNVLIFDLHNPEINFNLEKKTIREKIFCDAEIVDSTENYFLSADSIFQLKSQGTRTKEKSFNGSYSVKLDKNNPYSMTISLQNVRQGESFKISVMKNGAPGLGTIEITADDRADFYLRASSDNSDENAPGDWTKIEKEFYIPHHMDNKNLKIFLYNPSENPVFFDNLEIIKFNSILD